MTRRPLRRPVATHTPFYSHAMQEAECLQGAVSSLPCGRVFVSNPNHSQWCGSWLPNITTVVVVAADGSRQVFAVCELTCHKVPIGIEKMTSSSASRVDGGTVTLRFVHSQVRVAWRRH